MLLKLKLISEFLDIPILLFQLFIDLLMPIIFTCIQFNFNIILFDSLSLIM
jgi:hypothetical protein